MMIFLVVFSGALLLGTLVLAYLNWRILKVTEYLLAETIIIRKDTKVIREDTRRVVQLQAKSKVKRPVWMGKGLL
jgi:hypothetical protein